MDKILDPSKVGQTFGPHTVTVEEGRLRFFAKAVGETNPVYTDIEAAKKAGYQSLPAPPSFTHCLQFDRPNPYEVVEFLGIPIKKLLHGEQSFVFHKPICAGDRLVFETEITDIYDKKGGALEFAVTTTRFSNQDDEVVVEARSVLVVRH